MSSSCRAAFPDPVLAEAERAAATAWPREGRLDLRDLPFLTIDPPGSMDLDQAMLLERSGDGFTVRYAIADVAAVCLPAAPSSRRRGCAARPSTARTSASRCTRRPSARVPQACCLTRNGPRWCT